MVETINRTIRTSRQLTQSLGREPSAAEIAEVMKMPVQRVEEILKIAMDPISLETPVGEEDDTHLGDFIKTTKAKCRPMLQRTHFCRSSWMKSCRH